jgi:hypothetical protein
MKKLMHFTLNNKPVNLTVDGEHATPEFGDTILISFVDWVLVRVFACKGCGQSPL